MRVNILFTLAHTFLKITTFIVEPVSAPSGAPRFQISYPNTNPKNIFPMSIYTKFDQNQTKTVGVKKRTTNERRRTKWDIKIIFQMRPKFETMGFWEREKFCQ